MNTKIETLSDMLPTEDELEADLARLAELQELRDQIERLRETIGPLEAANRHLQAVRDECERQFQEKVARVNELDAEVEVEVE